MSLLLKTIKAFPNGSTLEELFVLLDCSFDDIRKKAIQVELAELIASKNVIYTNANKTLRSDVIEIDIKTKDTKIFMHEKDAKVNIINRN